MNHVLPHGNDGGRSVDYGIGRCWWSLGGRVVDLGTTTACLSTTKLLPSAPRQLCRLDRAVARWRYIMSTKRRLDATTSSSLSSSSSSSSVAAAAALAAAAAATTGTTVGEAAGSVVVAAKATKVAAKNDAPTEIAPVSWLIDRCWTNYYTIIL